MALSGTTALASFDTASGDIRRYERGGEGLRVTHVAAIGKGWLLTPNIFNAFRAAPPDIFSTRQVFVPVEPDTSPCA